MSGACCAGMRWCRITHGGDEEHPAEIICGPGRHSVDDLHIVE